MAAPCVHHTGPGLGRHDQPVHASAGPDPLLAPATQAGLCLPGGSQWLLVLYSGIGAFVVFTGSMPMSSYVAASACWPGRSPRPRASAPSLRAAAILQPRMCSRVGSLVRHGYRGPADDSARSGCRGLRRPPSQAERVAKSARPLGRGRGDAGRTSRQRARQHEVGQQEQHKRDDRRQNRVTSGRGNEVGLSRRGAMYR